MNFIFYFISHFAVGPTHTEPWDSVFQYTLYLDISVNRSNNIRWNAMCVGHGTTEVSARCCFSFDCSVKWSIADRW